MNAYTDVASPGISFSESPGSLIGDSLGQMVVENTTDAIFVMDTEGRTTFANPAAEEMFGWSSTELKGRKLHDVIHYKHRDGSAFPMSDCPLGQVLATGRGLKLYEDVFFRRNGSGIPVSCSNAILKADGAPTGAILIVRDISERVVAEQQRDLLLHELEHRLKNTIALVQAMAHQSFSDAPAGEKAAFDRRLVALSKAHDLLTAADWKEAELQDLIEAALRPFGEREQFTFSGPPVVLPSQAVVALVLAFHELGTNATKYGALSVEGGVVEIAWNLCSDPLELALTWSEKGGPSVVEPATTGFGMKLLQRGLARDLDGSIEIEFKRSGVECRIRAALPPSMLQQA